VVETAAADDTTGKISPEFTPRKGCQPREAGWNPFRIRLLLLTIRWCRFAQPPATVLQSLRLILRHLRLSDGKCSSGIARCAQPPAAV